MLDHNFRTWERTKFGSVQWVEPSHPIYLNNQLRSMVLGNGCIFKCDCLVVNTTRCIWCFITNTACCFWCFILKTTCCIWCFITNTTCCFWCFIINTTCCIWCFILSRLQLKTLRRRYVSYFIYFKLNNIVVRNLITHLLLSHCFVIQSFLFFLWQLIDIACNM